MCVSAFIIAHQVPNTLKEIKVTDVVAVTPFPVCFASVLGYSESQVHCVSAQENENAIKT